jgi:hypothetical protein
MEADSLTLWIALTPQQFDDLSLELVVGNFFTFMIFYEMLHPANLGSLLGGCHVVLYSWSLFSLNPRTNGSVTSQCSAFYPFAGMEINLYWRYQ